MSHFNDGNKHSYKPLRERLLAKLDRSGDCWVWTGAASTGGYGRIGGEDGAGTRQVHRIAYELLVGPIPPGMHIDHLCGNRRCANPDHLEPVTQAENNRRANAKRFAAMTHCARGHQFTPENTGWQKGRYRYCRECHRMQAKAKRRGLSVREYAESVA